MTNSLKASDDAAAAVQKTPNRVTLAALEAKIAGENYFTAGAAMKALAQPSMPAHSILTICVMTMKNGFIIIGKSAPADPDNFNAELGCKFAREDCMRQAWGFEGYLLRETLSHRDQLADGTKGY